MQPSQVEHFEVVSGKWCKVVKRAKCGLAYVGMPSEGVRQSVLDFLSQRSHGDCSQFVNVDIDAHSVRMSKVVSTSTPERRCDIVATWAQTAEEISPLRSSTLLNYVDMLIEQVLAGSKQSPIASYSGQACASGSFQQAALTQEGGLPLKRIRPKTRYHAISAEDLDPDTLQKFPIMVIDVKS
eukprot:TRINITY_DN75350_c0_g1_i1.p1 TRINITY_DN75350_c0_g1~~TRINITY_DN75350_c0_g1_i1.p1  ORF type:complete len:197 (+),score=20.05 TRINITY_DN75350_c0_g1_i1:44-592(+)